MSNQTQVFHSGLWSKLRGVQLLALPDRCRIMDLEETYDDINNAAEDYNTGGMVACRFFTGESIAAQGYEILAQSEIPRNSTWLALPLGTVVATTARIRITHRQNEAITPAEDYEVASPVVRGTTAVIVRLRPVDDYINP